MNEFMKLKKQQIMILAVVLVLVVSVVSVALLLNNENGEVPNGNGDVVESGEWIDLSDNIGAVASDGGNGVSDYIDVFFINDDEGWVVSSSAAEIYHTTDGGESWEAQTVQFTCGAICMINENEGYAGGLSGFIFKTTDGGTNWNLIGAASNVVTDLDFPTSTQGYACTDRGAVFGIIDEEITNLDSGSAARLAGITAPSIDHVWICGSGTIKFYNGSAWEWQSGPVGSYNAIFFLNNNEGWVVGNSGLIGVTDDGGAVWNSPSVVVTSESLFDVFFIDSKQGWVVGSSGAIAQTTDGGETWTSHRTQDTTSFFTSVYFPSSHFGYFCGNDGTLLKYVAEN
ncbi:MAG: hypothetical protein CW716_07540 [Candidatus Bathyarchaeum sp.]|nr:MAG: hypothetical protein CW716_07540 [Candidatus Bathyarchaeum sp.]